MESHQSIHLTHIHLPHTSRKVSALDYVIDSARQEVARIDGLIENILVTEGPESELLMDLYDHSMITDNCRC